LEVINEKAETNTVGLIYATKCLHKHLKIIEIIRNTIYIQTSEANNKSKRLKTNGK